MAILQHRDHPLLAQGKGGELLAVVPAHTPLRPKPQLPAPVFEDDVHLTPGQFGLGCVVPK